MIKHDENIYLYHDINVVKRLSIMLSEDVFTNVIELITLEQSIGSMISKTFIG